MSTSVPFTKDTQLYQSITVDSNGHLTDELPVRTPSTPTSQGGSTRTTVSVNYLPGAPHIRFQNSDQIDKFLQRELLTKDLNDLSSHLWLVAKQDSAHISSLTHQLVRGRQIVVTEKPELHLVWIYDRVFIKPIPRYLLSYDFWRSHLVSKAPPTPGDPHQHVIKAALGFMRSYLYLINHESDFALATHDDHKLLPKDMDIQFSAFVLFIRQFENIQDDAVSPRYRFGELRLSRLNFWTKIFLRKFTYYKVHGQYGAYFGRFYGPVLFVFAVFSLVLSAMQVALVVNPPPENGTWLALARASLGFSVFTMVCVALVLLFFLVAFVMLSAREVIFALKDLYRPSRGNQGTGTP